MPRNTWMHSGTHGVLSMEVLSSFQVLEMVQECILSHDAGVLMKLGYVIHAMTSLRFQSLPRSC